MTDRVNTLTVVLEQEMRIDDVEDILTSIRMVRGVLDVTPRLDIDDHWAARRQARHELVMQLWDVLK